jgi:hypothetical protein
MIVQRSGNLYLIGNRSEALCVDVNEGTIGEVLPAQSLCAHLVVAEPWRVITDHRHLPALVVEAVEHWRAPRPRPRPPS